MPCTALCDPLPGLARGAANQQQAASRRVSNHAGLLPWLQMLTLEGSPYKQEVTIDHLAQKLRGARQAEDGSDN